MKYIIANKEKAAKAGARTAGHHTRGKKIILDEKEALIFPGDTLEEKVAYVDGKIYTNAEIKEILKQGDWL